MPTSDVPAPWSNLVVTDEQIGGLLMGCHRRRAYRAVGEAVFRERVGHSWALQGYRSLMINRFGMWLSNYKEVSKR